MNRVKDLFFANMKFSELVEKAGIEDGKELRDVIAELELPINPKARIIPDQYVDQILAKYKGEEEVVEKVADDMPNADVDVDDIELDLDIESDETEDDEPKLNVDDEHLMEEEKIERELEKERRKTAAKKKTAEEEKEKERLKKQKEEEQLMPKDNVTLPEVISVKEFAEKVGLPVSKIMGELFRNGVIVTINHKIDFDTAMLVADAFGITVVKEATEYSSADLMKGNLTKLLEGEDPSTQIVRPAIVSIMGHVDHGKTSLLDYIRKSKVTATEAGGITQHIGAYQVKVQDKKITFLDTPGHEAFTAMRARGAKATDIAILVVAADEGVKPQTDEAINHAKDAEIPIIVALNKIDKEGANIDRVKGELSERGLVPEDWGGETIMAPISALTGDGIDSLLDMILLVADMNEIKANPERAAIGTIIESHLDSSLGPVATVLVNTGTLRHGDNFVVGDTYGRVKTMHSAIGKSMKDAEPSCPVRIAGFAEVPHVGDILQVMKTEKAAREKAMEMKALQKTQGIGSGMSFNDLIARFNKGELKQLKVVLKADTKGSLEAVRTSMMKLNTDEVEVSIIHSGVGNITETDVLMASASGGVILGFHVDSSAQVEKSAEKMNVTIKNYRVIYHLTEEIKGLLSGLLDPEIKETVLGDFEVLQVFFSNKKYMITGGKVTKGKIASRSKIRVIRGDKLIGEGTIDSLQKGMESVSDVSEGHECGIRFVGKCSPEAGDIFEVYKVEKIERSL